MKKNIKAKAKPSPQPPFVEQFQWQYRHLTPGARPGNKAKWVNEPALYDKLTDAITDAEVYASCRAPDCGGHRLVRILTRGSESITHGFLSVIPQR